MSKFKKKRGSSSPAISTASLPDIVFMLLFFFMVVTVIRENELKVDVTVPRADQLRKLEDKSLTTYMFIGKPIPQYQEQYGDAPQLQLNDKFAPMNQIPFFLEEKKLKIVESMRDRMIASLRVDNEVTMGFVTDVKTELRKAGQLKVNYAATLGDVGE
ncbi:MAG: biopolymer transport protein ExbD [Maribacter sp.]|jgi:biopolymer transport protein ExbD